MSGYDIEGARSAGISDADIAGALAPKLNYDLEGARKAGISDKEIADALAAKYTAPQQPVSQSPVAVANAGAGNLLAGMAGLPVDTTVNAGNLGIAAYGRLKGMFGGMPPDLIDPVSQVGSSEWIKNRMRAAGTQELSPDNPNPDSGVAKAGYDFISRGGVLPGGAIPAAASVIGEQVAGPSGAILGGLAPGGVRAMVREFPKPTLDANQQRLAEAGVKMTPGQMLGGAAQRVEDAATSIPIVGDAIKTAQRRGHESFDIGVLNQALEPIGLKVPKNAQVQPALAYTRGALGDAYDKLYSKISGDLNAPPASQPNAVVPATGQPPATSLRFELESIRDMGQNLGEQQAKQLNSIIDNEVIKRFTSSGKASGETLQNIREELGDLSKRFRQSDNYDTRKLGQAVTEIRASLDRMIYRQNPTAQGEIDALGKGYGLFKQAQRAAGYVGTNDGVFTPGQYNRAVRAGDTTKDKRAFSEGTALGQDMASAGKDVLSQTVPDSGTALRGLAGYLMAHPLKATIGAVPVAAASAAYSPAVQAMMQKYMVSGAAIQRPMSPLQLLQQELIARDANR